MSRLASAAGLALVAASGAAYVAYTLAGDDSFAPFLLERRRSAVLTGLSLAGLGTLTAPNRPGAWVALGLAGALAGYAQRRQWLTGHSARGFVPGEAGPIGRSDDGLVVVLPDGGAVPLRSAARARVLFAGQWLVVHCGLARSVAVFEAPRAEVVAVLPHRSGFWIRVGERLLDGVDGSATHGGQGLLPAPVAVRRLGGWLAAGGRTLYRSTADQQRAAAFVRDPTPRVPGARGVSDPMRIGSVLNGLWEPLRPEGPAILAPSHLARWAARARGLEGVKAGL